MMSSDTRGALVCASWVLWSQSVSASSGKRPSTAAIGTINTAMT